MSRLCLLRYSSLLLLKWWAPLEDLVAEQPQVLEKECYEVPNMALPYGRLLHPQVLPD